MPEQITEDWNDAEDRLYEQWRALEEEENG